MRNQRPLRSTSIACAAAIVLAAGLAADASARPPRAAGEERPRQPAPSAPAQPAPAPRPQQPSPQAAPRQPQSAGGGGMRLSRPSVDGQIRVRTSEPSSVRPQPSATPRDSARPYSEPVFRQPQSSSAGARRLTAPQPGGGPSASQPSRPIVRAPRSEPRIISLPSGAETARRAAAESRGGRDGSRTRSNPGTIGQPLTPATSAPSIGIRLPSGVDTARASRPSRSPGLESRPPAAAGPSLRIDAPGAPARALGSSAASIAPTGIISANARDRQGPSDARPGRSDDRDRRDRPRGDRDHQWRGDRHDRDDHHDHARHGSRRSNWSWSFGSAWCATPYTYTRPTNYVYNFGGPWYTDIFPSGTWGYSTPLYAWQYETPIYAWDSAPYYATTGDVWAWRDSLSPLSTTFVTGGTYTIPSFVVGDAGAVGGVQGSVVLPGAAPGADSSSVNAELRRAEARLLARINPRYDVLPDFGDSLDAVSTGDYSASIHAMRRAAGVNPSALMGAGTPVSSVIASDQGMAQRVQYARQVFQNPPQRVVSEADAHFMVGALDAALGDTVAADAALGAAQSAGDVSASTELLRRAVQGRNLDPSAVWSTP